MHRLQLRRRQPGGRVALVALDLVGRAQLLQQPQDALRARIVEVVDDEHGVLLGWGIAKPAPVCRRGVERRLWTRPGGDSPPGNVFVRGDMLEQKVHEARGGRR